MTSEVYTRILHLSQELMLDSAKPTRSLIEEVLSFDALRLTDLTNQDLSRYIVAMGQYLVQLQHYENLKTLAHALAQKNLGIELSKKKFNLTDTKLKSEKERNNYLIINDPDIAKLDEQATAAEAEKILMSGMVTAVEQLLNALKKEKSGRDS